MSTQVTATHAKTHLLQLLDEVESGEDVEITRRGRTIARIVPAKGPHALKDMFKGAVRTADPSDQLFSTGVKWEASDDDPA